MPSKKSKRSKNLPPPSSPASGPPTPTPNPKPTVQSYIRFDLPSDEVKYEPASTIGDVKKDMVELAFEELEQLCGTKGGPHATTERVAAPESCVYSNFCLSLTYRMNSRHSSVTFFNDSSQRLISTIPSTRIFCRILR